MMKVKKVKTNDEGGEGDEIDEICEVTAIEMDKVGSAQTGSKVSRRFCEKLSDTLLVIHGNYRLYEHTLLDCPAQLGMVVSKRQSPHTQGRTTDYPLACMVLSTQTQATTSVSTLTHLTQAERTLEVRVTLTAIVGDDGYHYL